MTTRECLAFGLRTVFRARNLFMIFCLLLVNVGVAVAAAFPFYRRMDEALSRQPAAESLISSLTMSFLVDFRSVNAEFFEDLTYTVGGAVFLMFLLHVFFAGGLLAVFHSEDRSFTFPKFFAGSGTYFLRFLRLAVLTLAALFGISEAKRRFLDPIVERAEAAQTSEWGGLLWQWWPALAVLLVVTFVVLVADYAKVRTVVEGRKSMLGAIVRSLVLILRHPRRTLGLFFLIALLEGGVLLLFTVFQRFAENVRSTAALVAALVLSQALVFSRLAFRALHFSAEVATAKDLLSIPQGRGGVTARDLGLRPGPAPAPVSPTFRYSEPEITELPPIDVPAPVPASAMAAEGGHDGKGESSVDDGTGLSPR
jgi:hypothetical protein